MTACLTRRQLTCFGTLFHVKHSDDVTSDDFYMTPDNISDDTRASNAAHDHSTDSRHSETAPRLKQSHGSSLMTSQGFAKPCSATALWHTLSEHSWLFSCV